MPIAPTPEMAAPQPSLLRLLQALAGRPGTTSVHLVSGRPADVLAAWFGHLPIALWAEHGAFHRASPERHWEPTQILATDWMPQAVRILEDTTAATPGSFIERKTVSVAWHYRAVDEELGASRAHELRVALRPLVRHHAVDVLEGRKVIEVRPAGVTKGVVADRLAAEGNDAPEVLAIGDDWTDEDLFNALPESSVTVAVGRRRSAADYQLPDDTAVRALLQSLVD